jgi:salicylate hydroxylase
MVTKTLKWPIQMIDVPDTWVHKSNKLLISGDAAHAMLPNMSLGAAMAVEDAAALAECLDFAAGKQDLRGALQLFQDVRIPRVKHVHEASVLHGQTLHFPDGPVQQARDAAMRAEVEGRHFVESPNQWSDPTMQVWCYSYNVVEEVKRIGAESYH